MNKQKYIDLTYDLTPEIASWDSGCGFNLANNVDYSDCKAPNLFRVQEITTRAGMGTHIDAPAHCVPGATTIEELKLDDLITDCIVIRTNNADQSSLITPEIINNFEKQWGQIKENTFVVFHTGWDKHWDEPTKYRNDLKFPSVHPDSAKFLLERNIAGIGIDTLSPDAIGDDFPVHRLILGAGKYLVENVANAAAMPECGAKIMIMPMNIKGGTEAPIRLVGIIDES